MNSWNCLSWLNSFEIRFWAFKADIQHFVLMVWKLMLYVLWDAQILTEIFYGGIILQRYLITVTPTWRMTSHSHFEKNCYIQRWKAWNKWSVITWTGSRSMLRMTDECKLHSETTENYVFQFLTILQLFPNQLLLIMTINIIGMIYIWHNCDVAGFIPGSCLCHKLRATDIPLETLINILHLDALYLLEFQHPAALRHEFILCRLFGGRPGCDELTWKSSQWRRLWCSAVVK